MAAKQGRLFVKKSDEGGADQIYDGAAQSAFDSGGKGGAAWAQKADRFKDKEMAPEVDVHVAGIGDAAAGKASANFDQRKPRFKEAAPSGPDYDVAKSDFDKANSGRPSPMMMTPEKNKGRSDGWIANPEQVNSPPPAMQPGAFENAKGGGAWSKSSTGGDRFKQQHQVASHGDAGNAPLQSSFASAANARPSPSALAGGDRFKKAYDVPSYGDPGAGESLADVQNREREAKLARQQQQAAIAAERDAAKYQ
jgi:hypothetical protein